MEGAVELAIAAAGEAVTDGLSGGGWDRCAAGQGGEGGLGAEATRVRPGGEDLRGADHADTRLGEQCRCELASERLEL